MIASEIFFYSHYYFLQQYLLHLLCKKMLIACSLTQNICDQQQIFVNF